MTLVDRLRDRGVCGNDHGDAKHLMLDAADAIARLTAERDALAERIRAVSVIPYVEAWCPSCQQPGALRESGVCDECWRDAHEVDA